MAKLTFIFGIIIIAVIFLYLSSPIIFCERGTIEGIYCDGRTEGYGDFCGQYPYTQIKLKNYSISGDYDDWGDGRFYFGNQWVDISKIEKGDRIKIGWHEASRLADSDPGVTVYYYVIDWIDVSELDGD